MEGTDARPPVVVVVVAAHQVLLAVRRAAAGQAVKEQEDGPQVSAVASSTPPPLVLTGGNSKGYAFLEFQDPEVATIAAEAMDGYFLSKNKLVCHVVAPEKLHPKVSTSPL